jgi:hypothetical protein
MFRERWDVVQQALQEYNLGRDTPVTPVPPHSSPTQRRCSPPSGARVVRARRNQHHHPPRSRSNAVTTRGGLRETSRRPPFCRKVQETNKTAKARHASEFMAIRVGWRSS